jgi:hypothetical protein
LIFGPAFPGQAAGMIAAARNAMGARYQCLTAAPPA